MTGTKISMSGADGAHFRAATATSTRLIPFPDGFTRHITLTNRQWEVFDNVWLPSQWAEGAVHVVTEVTAQHGPGNYENDLRNALIALLAAAMPDCSAHPRQPGNENIPEAGDPLQ